MEFLSEFFEIHSDSDVRQGGVLSPLLFGIDMDWIENINERQGRDIIG